MVLGESRVGCLAMFGLRLNDQCPSISLPASVAWDLLFTLGEKSLVVLSGILEGLGLGMGKGWSLPAYSLPRE